MKTTFLIVILCFLGVFAFAQTQFDVKYKDLPKDTQKYISKTYDGWTVDKATMGENAKGKMTFCDAYISKGTEKLKLVFDKDGEFVKKEVIPEEAKVQPAPAAVPATVAPAVVPAAEPAVPDTTKQIK